MDAPDFSPLITRLQDLGFSSEQLLTKILQECVVKRLPKSAALVKEGEVCQSIYFVLHGCLRQYKFADGDESVTGLFLAHDWVLDHPSFISQKPSGSTIECYSDCVVVELTVYAAHRLIAQTPAFLQLGKILEPDRLRSALLENSLTPKEKYDYILRERPALLQHFPLKFIASFLCITPETLSRVRGQG